MTLKLGNMMDFDRLLFFFFVSLFITIIGLFIARNRIIRIKKDYAKLMVEINKANWNKANLLLESLKNKNALNYRQTNFLMNLTNQEIDKIQANSCLENAKKLIDKNEFNQAFELLNKAVNLTDSDNYIKIEDIYVSLISKSIAVAKKKYINKNYESAKSSAEKCLTYLNKLSFKNNYFKTKYTKIADNLIQKCKAKIKKENKNTTIVDDQDYFANDVSGRDMALAFNLLKFKGETSKIGWMLKIDIKNILEEFGYYNHTITGGTKIKLYDQIVYQVVSYKNNMGYYIYLNSNLGYNQWAVTGIYLR